MEFIEGNLHLLKIDGKEFGIRKSRGGLLLLESSSRVRIKVFVELQMGKWIQFQLLKAVESGSHAFSANWKINSRWVSMVKETNKGGIFLSILVGWGSRSKTIRVPAGVEGTGWKQLALAMNEMVSNKVSQSFPMDQVTRDEVSSLQGISVVPPSRKKTFVEVVATNLSSVSPNPMARQGSFAANPIHRDSPIDFLSQVWGKHLPPDPVERKNLAWSRIELPESGIQWTPVALPFGHTAFLVFANSPLVSSCEASDPPTRLPTMKDQSTQHYSMLPNSPAFHAVSRGKVGNVSASPSEQIKGKGIVGPSPSKGPKSFSAQSLAKTNDPQTAGNYWRVLEAVEEDVFNLDPLLTKMSTHARRDRKRARKAQRNRTADWANFSVFPTRSRFMLQSRSNKSSSTNKVGQGEPKVCSAPAGRTMGETSNQTQDVSVSLPYPPGFEPVAVQCVEAHDLSTNLCVSHAESFSSTPDLVGAPPGFEDPQTKNLGFPLPSERTSGMTPFFVSRVNDSAEASVSDRQSTQEEAFDRSAFKDIGLLMGVDLNQDEIRALDMVQAAARGTIADTTMDKCNKLGSEGFT